MLVELAVANLGVIEQVTLQLPGGMIALTGETGAGKTLLVDAISLLVGGRAHPGLVRPGATEAIIDGRFLIDGEEVVLSRIVPADGRSRAYVNGRPATMGALAEWGARLLDLHGQHDHQSLLGAEAQRDALDRFGHVDLGPYREARRRRRELDEALAELGGDARTRAREIDLLRYQVDELGAAALDDPDEDRTLAETEDTLANAVEYTEAAASALASLADDGGARDALAQAIARIGQRPPFRPAAERLTNLLAELDDSVEELRVLTETIEPDPEGLAAVQARRSLLHQLCRKYGDTLAEVIAERDALQARLAELESHDERAARLDAERAAVDAALAEAEAGLLDARMSAAPRLADAIAAHLVDLDMGKARIGIEVAGPGGANVVFQLAANPGAPLQPLAKVASGGELSRTMLALRSVLSEAPPVLVFDEVDAGIGGQTGLAIGRALAALADRHQVLVVTHLPQVAAFADAHLLVVKDQGEDHTSSGIQLLDDVGRQTELARMLSGQPDSDTARQHAGELLASAAAQRA